MLFGLCAVVVEVIVRGRPRRAVGSALSTQRSSIACAKSSRTLPQPASVEAGPSGRLPAAAPVVMNLACRRPRIAIRVPPPATWKRPRSGHPQPGPNPTTAEQAGDSRGLASPAVVLRARAGAHDRHAGEHVRAARFARGTRARRATPRRGALQLACDVDPAEPSDAARPGRARDSRRAQALRGCRRPHIPRCVRQTLTPRTPCQRVLETYERWRPVGPRTAVV